MSNNHSANALITRMDLLFTTTLVCTFQPRNFNARNCEVDQRVLNLICTRQGSDVPHMSLCCHFLGLKRDPKANSFSMASLLCLCRGKAHCGRLVLLSKMLGMVGHVGTCEQDSQENHRISPMPTTSITMPFFRRAIWGSFDVIPEASCKFHTSEPKWLRKQRMKWLLHPNSLTHPGDHWGFRCSFSSNRRVWSQGPFILLGLEACSNN